MPLGRRNTDDLSHHSCHGLGPLKRLLLLISSYFCLFWCTGALSVWLGASSVRCWIADKQGNITLIQCLGLVLQTRMSLLRSTQTKVPHSFLSSPDEMSVAFPQKCSQLGKNAIFHWKSHVIQRKSQWTLIVSNVPFACSTPSYVLKISLVTFIRCNICHSFPVCSHR